MDNKIGTFDAGLDYLYQAKKDCRADFFGLAKLESFRRLFGLLGGIGHLFRRKELAHETPKKLRRNPWRTLAFTVCIAFTAGMIARKILAAK